MSVDNSQRDSARSSNPENRREISGAVRVAAALEIASARLTNFAALTSYGAFDTLPTDVSAKVAFTRPKTKTAGTRVAITSTLLFRVLPSEGPPLVDIRATAELVYVRKAEVELDEADVEQFAAVNAPFNAWAFWREFVQSALTRMNLPPFALPLFRIADATKLMVADESDDLPAHHSRQPT